jgi:uncharacterized membrane protein
MTPAELSRQWREGSDSVLSRRRGVIGLSLAAAASMGLITLYQTGIIHHLPEPPLPGLDADRVDASDEAYSRFSVPDGALGLGSYALTLGLAAMGGADRARRQPWIPLALAAKVGFDLTQAIRLTYQQPTKYRAFCFWCLLASAATLASVPLVLPETIAAIRQLK